MLAPCAPEDRLGSRREVFPDGRRFYEAAAESLAGAEASSGTTVLAGASPSKWPRRCSQTSRTSAGRPASAQMAKNHTQPVAAAMKPAPAERYVRPKAASAVNSAYCVAVCKGLRQSADR